MDMGDGPFRPDLSPKRERCTIVLKRDIGRHWEEFDIAYPDIALLQAGEHLRLVGFRHKGKRRRFAPAGQCLRRRIEKEAHLVKAGGRRNRYGFSWAGLEDCKMVKRQEASHMRSP